MGDGEALWQTEEELRADVEAGVEDAVKRGKAQPLANEDIAHLMDILKMPEKNVSVERGCEGIHTFDAGTLKIPIRLGVPVSRHNDVLIHERVLCSDTMELCNTDYSYKMVKNIAPEEAMQMEQLQQDAIIPVFYGAMPNLGLYTKPDGQFDNWAELLPEGRIKEGMEAQEGALEQCCGDMVFVASQQCESGADGIQFDTAGASGDADLLASLKASKILKEKYPDTCITMGMANEFTLGMHGRLKFEDDKLAGQYPRDQVKTCAKAGVDMYGAVVNTNSSRSFAWNLARSLTFVKECTQVATIPVLVNAGMGVGGIPLSAVAPTDTTTRVSKSMLEIGKADGL
jgi:dimethylamine--corrinoid protein Co-methyltransferase